MAFTAIADDERGERRRTKRRKTRAIRYHLSCNERMVNEPYTRQYSILSSAERAKANAIKRMYNITLDDYHHMLMRQCGCCAMCDKQSTYLAIDHCHVQGHVRALLCMQCNLDLGVFEKPGLRTKVDKYLDVYGDNRK